MAEAPKRNVYVVTVLTRVAGAAGFEPATLGFGDRRSTTHFKALVSNVSRPFTGEIQRVSRQLLTF